MYRFFVLVVAQEMTVNRLFSLRVSFSPLPVAPGDVSTPEAPVSFLLCVGLVFRVTSTYMGSPSDIVMVFTLNCQTYFKEFQRRLI